MANFIPVEPEKWAEMVKAAASSDYWRIEAETDHARWLRTLEENEKLREENKRLHQLGDAMAERLVYQGYPITANAWFSYKMRDNQ